MDNFSNMDSFVALEDDLGESENFDPSNSIIDTEDSSFKDPDQKDRKC